MIGGKDFYDIVAAIFPLYVAMFLGYGSIQWWKILTPEQSAGVSRYVSMIAVPALTLNFIYSLDPYHMNLKFIGADTLQKVVILIVLFLWNIITKRGGFDWTITLFALSTLPNTLLVGVPLLNAMYGEFTTPLMVQIVLMQSVVWNNLLLFLFEYRAAKIFLSQKLITDAPRPVDVDVVVTQENVDTLSKGGSQRSIEMSLRSSLSAKVSDIEIEIEAADGGEQGSQQQEEQATTNNEQQILPPAGGTTMFIIIRMWKKLIQNPNIYAALLGLAWSLIASRWHLKLPKIISGSISIMSNTGLGMAMFSLGVFMALQPKIIACGKIMLAVSLVMKFLVGPAVMAGTSAVIGIRGNILRVAIVQAALMQGVIPFVFARQYNLHAEILSTSFMVGMALNLPVTIVYYVLIGL